MPDGTSPMASLPAFAASQYTIGWIVALPVEYASAKAMLDEKHANPVDFERADTDSNSYTCGRIGEHKVVIACLASGVYGNTMATATAIPMLNSFPNVKIGLMVGLGAGIPSSDNDIRLGDVVVSQPTGNSGGLVQYDLGKACKDGHWIRKDYLARPPEVLLKALNNLQSEHELGQSRISYYLEESFQRLPEWRDRFAYPNGKSDNLYQTSYSHPDEGTDCTDCDSAHLIKRPSRSSNRPEVHYGIIASGNTCVKDAALRDRIGKMYDSKCLEMEAAGLMNNFPCVVIRGISDYADSHKNKLWQRYASATAAAFAKELLVWVPRNEVSATVRVTEIIERTSDAIIDRIDKFEKIVEKTVNSEAERKVDECLQALYTCPYLERKNRNEERVEGTCNWFTNHENFKRWQERESGILWVSADPGCGKSVLSRYLIDDVLQGGSNTVCYYFFKDDFADQRLYTDALCALLHQVFTQQPGLLTPEILRSFAAQRSTFTQTASTLWETLVTVAKNPDACTIICVFDALDECQEKDRRELVGALRSFGLKSNGLAKLKFLVTSRPYQDISHEFFELEKRCPSIRLKGENETELAQIAGEIDLVIRYRIDQIGETAHLKPTERDLLRTCLTGIQNRTYLWAHLILDHIKASLKTGGDSMRDILSLLPQTVDDVYEKMLGRSSDRKLAERLFSVVIGSFRPLTIKEITACLYISGQEKSYDDFLTYLGSEERMKANIRELSGLLVNIIDSKVYLIHQTAKEFLLNQTSSGAEHAFAHPNLPVKARVSSASSSMSSQRVDKKWKHLFNLTSIHAELASICVHCLHLEAGDFAELEHYCVTSLFAHLSLAESYISAELLESAATLLDQKLRTHWSLILRHMPDYERETMEYCPPATAPVIYLISYLGIRELFEYWVVNHKYKGSKREFGHSRLSIIAAKGDPYLFAVFLKNHSNIIRRNQHSSDLLVTVRRILNYKGLYGTTAFHAAAQCGRCEIAQLLLEYNADIEAKRDDGFRPLHIAVEHGQTSMVKQLLESGADIEARAGSQSSTPLLQAVCNETIPIVKLLLSKGANIKARSGKGDSSDPRRNAVHHAVFTGNEELLKILLDAGSPINGTDAHGCTPLMYAIRNDLSSKMLETLINGSADVEKKDAGGWKPLSEALARRNFAAVKVLIKHNATITSADITVALQPRKPSAPHVVDWQGTTNKEIAEYLLEQRTITTQDSARILSDPNIIIDSGLLQKLTSNASKVTSSSLTAALQRGKHYRKYGHLTRMHDETIQVILDKFDGASLKDASRQTLAQAAFELDDPETTSLLIRRNIFSLKEYSPDKVKSLFFSAARQGNLALTTLLLNKLITVDQRNDSGRTALSLAIGHGMTSPNHKVPVLSEERKKEYDEVIKLLLQRGADPDLVASKSRRTPRTWAEIAENKTAKQLIEDYGIIGPNVAGAKSHRRAVPAAADTKTRKQSNPLSALFPAGKSSTQQRGQRSTASKDVVRF